MSFILNVIKRLKVYIKLLQIRLIKKVFIITNENLSSERH